MLVVQGVQLVTFDFAPSKTSSRSETKPLDPPGGTNRAWAVLKSFDLFYSDSHQYGYGRLQVDVEAESVQTAKCTVTLRDDNTDEREWEGGVEALVFFFQAPE